MLLRLLVLVLYRALIHTPGTASGSESASAPTSNGSSSSSGNSSSSASTSTDADASTAAASTPASTAAPAQDQEAEQYPTPGAAVEAAVAAGLPQHLVDAMTADALAEEGPALVDEWTTWLRLWRARLAEEGIPEEVIVGHGANCAALSCRTDAVGWHRQLCARHTAAAQRQAAWWQCTVVMLWTCPSWSRAVVSSVSWC